VPEGMTPRIEYEYQVMFFDTDCTAIVHNLAYLRIIETARTLLAERLGLDMPTLAQKGIFPVLLSTEVDYRKPAQLSDKLVVRGGLESVERVRFWCSFEVVKDSTVFVTCRQSLALIQMPQGKPTRLPDDWIEKYAHLRAR
jgi:YbgC/YbaW family acyl-CoA thioester hydrolase